MNFNRKSISFIQQIKNLSGLFFSNDSILFPQIRNVGVLKETKAYENRVGLTPRGLAFLALKHPEVVFFVQRGAGLLSGFLDSDYLNAAPKGRVILMGDPEAVILASDLIIKFKEPTAQEVTLISDYSLPKVIFDYGHYAGNKKLALQALASKGFYFTFETARKDGRNILLEPMSRIAGQIAIDLANEFFNSTSLMGKNVAVYGGLGVAGLSAAYKALEQDVFNLLIIEPAAVIKARRKSSVHKKLFKDPRVTFYDPAMINLKKLKEIDLIVSAAYKYGQMPPMALDQELSESLDALNHPILFIDIPMDQGGSAFYTRGRSPQVHGMKPEPLHKNLYHSYIANLPSLAKREASLAQEEVNLPYFSKLISFGKNFERDEVLASAVNFAGGYNVIKGLEEDLNIKYTPLNKLKFKY